jgi:hypothetical protein
MKTDNLNYLTCIILTTALSACGSGGSSGGGGSSATSSAATTVSEAYAKSVSANTSTVSNDAVIAQTQTILASQTVIANAQVNQTYNCMGGGTASFQLTGAGPTQLINGALDAGEKYTISFSNCKASTGASAVNGSMTLNIDSATASSFALSTVTTNLAVALPQGRVTLNGSSNLQFSSSTQGNVVTSNLRWTTPSITITTAYNLRTSTFTLSNIDLNNQVSTINGVISTSQSSGTSTWSATLASGSYSITTATQGTITYDSSGLPTQGAWTATFPNNKLSLSIAAGTAKISVDYGADGSTDATYNMSVSDLVREVG